MKQFLTIAVVISVAGIFAASPASAEASAEEAKKCEKMIKNMVGVDPSPKVIKLCKAGKTKEAMKAAMAGE